MTEQRVALWIGVACTVVLATPTARALWREWQVCRARKDALRRQSVRMTQLPSEWTRDIYDSVRVR